MLEKIIYFDCALVLLDFVTISELRKFLFDFIRAEKSKNNAASIYAAQSFGDKISLSFIRKNIAKHIKAFNLYHKLYIAVLYTLFPQYIILIVSNILVGIKSMYILCIFAAVKLIISALVRINVDSNRVSIYRNK